MNINYKLIEIFNKNFILMSTLNISNNLHAIDNPLKHINLNECSLTKKEKMKNENTNNIRYFVNNYCNNLNSTDITNYVYYQYILNLLDYNNNSLVESINYLQNNKTADFYNKNQEQEMYMYTNNLVNLMKDFISKGKNYLDIQTKLEEINNKLKKNDIIQIFKSNNMKNIYDMFFYLNQYLSNCKYNKTHNSKITNCKCNSIIKHIICMYSDNITTENYESNLAIIEIINNIIILNIDIKSIINLGINHNIVNDILLNLYKKNIIKSNFLCNYLYFNNSYSIINILSHNDLYFNFTITDLLYYYKKNSNNISFFNFFFGNLSKHNIPSACNIICNIYYYNYNLNYKIDNEVIVVNVKEYINLKIIDKILKKIDEIIANFNIKNNYYSNCNIILAPYIELLYVAYNNKYNSFNYTADDIKNNNTDNNKTIVFSNYKINYDVTLLNNTLLEKLEKYKIKIKNYEKTNYSLYSLIMLLLVPIFRIIK